MRPPHTIHPTWPEGIPSGRFASAIETESPEGCRVALIGLPDDTGIRLNHGRPGAALGPAAFRAALTRYGHPAPSGLPYPKVYDAGDLEPASELDETHDRVTQAAKWLHEQGLFPIAIGGGHDLTFPFVRAAANHHGPLAGIYLDAHIDVRPEPGSGMPFHRLLEGNHAKLLHAIGIDRLAASAERTNWFAANNGHIDALHHDDPDEAFPQGPMFASLDLDVIDQAFAPGVSANNPNGWTPAHAEAWVTRLARCSNLVSFDIMELSPPHDPNHHTARLTARLFLAFLHAFAERPA